MQRTRNLHFGVLTMSVGEMGVISVETEHESARRKLAEMMLNQIRVLSQRVSVAP